MRLRADSGFSGGKWFFADAGLDVGVDECIFVNI